MHRAVWLSGNVKVGNGMHPFTKNKVFISFKSFPPDNNKCAGGLFALRQLRNCPVKKLWKISIRCPVYAERSWKKAWEMVSDVSSSSSSREGGQWQHLPRNNPGLFASQPLTNCPLLFVSPSCVSRSYWSMSLLHTTAYSRAWHLSLAKRVTHCVIISIKTLLFSIFNTPQLSE